MRRSLWLHPLLTTLLRCLLFCFPSPFLIRPLDHAILGIIMEIRCCVTLNADGGLRVFLLYCRSLRVVGCLLILEGFLTVSEELAEFLLRIEHT